MPKLKGYKLSERADVDLEDIFDYTEFHHGANQAIKYLTDLETVFKALVVNPEIGRQRNEIKVGLYSIPEQEHIIFYRILKDYIRIVRVLHGSKDIPKQF
ncbi:type II toxin-antitoxin system RelE/ParE family toxin [Seonamhaeicola sp.]|uniref:type II toxin-antitoxin system RelE/ParE family toxin n=1 Tax=Seonamhaeicola sp. TaxID=1912245 RepID=UPI002639AAE0|nr:type II toxin-antitoxin system RelE/ParE family toxin [Seonamhaeicola sp.]